MTLIVLASNVLVQFPLAGTVGRLALGDLLTWGAFTYPFAFLVTDLTNRRFGPAAARRVVYAGFTVAVATSILVPPVLFDRGLLPYAPELERLARVAIASGTAFLVAQLLDVSVFNALRQGTWWRAPAFASVAGSVVDTGLFFTLAFGSAFLFLGPNDGFALEPTGLFGVMTAEAPRWVSWALGDLAVKLVIAAFALIPYRLLMARLMPFRPAQIAGA
ncbi:MAG: queuosine precursor transporter [Rhizobiaceae bacterium]|nr:queuosine precursor transporter [Rhizobiaceae bacterium]